jgi:ribonuclease HI
MAYTLNFDGASKGNPGIGSYGVVIYDCDDNEIYTKSHFIGNNVTNNYAEYSGLYKGLKIAAKNNLYPLVVKGDSNLVIQQMKGHFKCRSKNLEQLYEKCMTLDNKNITYVHVERKYNSRADELANLVLKK